MLQGSRYSVVAVLGILYLSAIAVYVTSNSGRQPPELLNAVIHLEDRLAAVQQQNVMLLAQVPKPEACPSLPPPKQLESSLSTEPPITTNCSLVKAARDVTNQHFKPLKQQWNYASCLKQEKQEMGKFYEAGADARHQHFHPYLTTNSIVVEIGGNICMFASKIVESSNPTMYIFEPIPEFYKKCADRFRDHPNVHVYPWAIANEEGNLTLYLSGSNNEASTQFDQKGQGITVPKRTLESIVNELNIPRIDLLSVNCEGCEFILLPHWFKTGFLTMVAGLQIQFHRDAGFSLAQKCAAEGLLSLTHTLVYDYTWVWSFWRLDRCDRRFLPATEA